MIAPVIKIYPLKHYLSQVNKFEVHGVFTSYHYVNLTTSEKP